MTIPERVEETHADEHDEEEILYCTVHPTVQTTLRCNRCGRPMCTKCAVILRSVTAVNNVCANSRTSFSTPK